MLKPGAPAFPGRLPATRGAPHGAWLWLADVGPATRPAWIEQHMAWLSAGERARLARITRPERRAQLLAGHILLRHLVAARSGTDARSVRIGTAADGRPEVDAPGGWQPSLAHSKQWVAALLVGGERAIGVDIEWMDPRRQIETIVEAACAIDAGSRAQAYLLWAQREAEIKAGAPAVSTHVAAWGDRALAVCAGAVPSATLVVDLETNRPLHRLDLTWLPRPPLAALGPVLDREHG